MPQMLHWPHWRLFLYTMSGPMVFFFLAGYELVSDSSLGGFSVLDENLYLNLLLWGFNVILAVWEWTVGHALYRRLPEGMEMNLNYFQAAVIIPVVFNFGDLCLSAFNPGAAHLPMSSSMGCLMATFTLYVYYFIAKSLTSVEGNEPTAFGEFIGEFLLMLFLLVGIWFIQPRINRVFEEKEGMEKHLIG